MELIKFLNLPFARAVYRAQAFGQHYHMLLESRGDAVAITATAYLTLLLVAPGGQVTRLTELNPGREVVVDFPEGSELQMEALQAGAFIPFEKVA